MICKAFLKFQSTLLIVHVRSNDFLPVEPKRPFTKMCDEEEKIFRGLGKHCRSEKIVTAENYTTVYSRQKWDMHKSALIIIHLPLSEAVKVG